MYKSRLITIFNLILVTSLILNGRLSHAQVSDSAPVNPNENEGRLRAWLASAGLAKTFEIIRIGVGPHPDRRFALDGMIQHLELRFVTESPIPAEEAARFEKLLADYQREHASSLPEKLLNEFVNVFAIDPRNACVDLHLYDSVYSIYFSRDDDSLVISQGPARGDYDAFSVTIPGLAPQEQFRAHLGNQSAPDSKAVRDAIEKFLRTYLGSTQGKGSPQPEIITDARRQDGYLRLLVSGAKGMVTDGYWEWLDIAVFFHQDPASATGKDSQWDFVCNVEVRYASSARETRPTDADFDFARQVAQFRTRLNQQLQANLEKGIHE